MYTLQFCKEIYLRVNSCISASLQVKGHGEINSRYSLAAGGFYVIILKPFVPTWKAGIVNFLAMFCKTNPATIPGITDCSVPYREGKKKKKG